ncbi:MAG: phosphate ABC transporter substrate-binding protein PstS [Myxococcota bacterium]
MRRRRLLLFAVLAATACDVPRAFSEVRERRQESDGRALKTIALNGAGATFPYPLYSKWMSEYNRINPRVRINYQSIGSGGGIRQALAGTVDFGATDVPMKEDEQRRANNRLLHIPTTLGSVVLSYNLPGAARALRLNAEALAAIFLGEVKRWDDPRLASLNPELSLPSRDIAVVFRTDGSGTTAIFSEYLARHTPEFARRVGSGKSVRWPTGFGAKGNEGVTGQVKSTPFSIGYIELAYAVQNKLPTAEIQNRSGKFVAPSVDAATAAADSVEMPDSLHVSLADAAGESAYPIASYTYLLVPEDVKDVEKGEWLARFLWWAVHDGQRYSQDLDYARLPEKVVVRIESKLKSLRSGEKRLLEGV